MEEAAFSTEMKTTCYNLMKCLNGKTLCPYRFMVGGDELTWLDSIEVPLPSADF